ncbi:hypothetical protein ABIC29_001651 [Agromyces sp. PvR057]
MTSTVYGAAAGRPSVSTGTGRIRRRRFQGH